MDPGQLPPEERGGGEWEPNDVKAFFSAVNDPGLWDVVSQERFYVESVLVAYHSCPVFVRQGRLVVMLVKFHDEVAWWDGVGAGV